MSSDKSFRGTLLLLQNKTKRDPESYVDEFRTQLRHFQAVCKTMLAGASHSTGSTAAAATVEASSASNPQFLAVMQFVSQVAYCYPAECKDLPQLLIDLLHHVKASLPVEARACIVNCLLLLRSKNLATAQQTLPVLFELLEARDKTLRRTILAHVVSDVRRINLPGAKAGSAAVNKHIQNFLFKVMEDDDPVQARSALVVMIDLYRRQLWCNEKTVSVISKACFSRHTLILRMALHFFLMQMPKFSTVGSDEDEEADIDPGRLISKLKHKLKHKSKTVHREKVLKTKVDKLKKRFDADKREEEATAKQHVDPVRLLTDCQGFAERLLARLAKTTERFEVRILMMSVLARVINEHDLVLLGVYPLFERYFEPTQLHATNILALASTCVHRMVPPEPVESMVRTLADRFVNDRSDRDSITIGINTIREICKRQPLAMNADLLADLIGYRQRRGERGVIMAARALLQLYREVNPDLLPAKVRGSLAGPSAGSKAIRFGAEPPLREIPGLEALFGADEEGKNSDVANSDDLDDGTESSMMHITTDSDDDSADGEWQLVTDDSDADAFSDDPEVDDDDVDPDEVPQLVPIQAKAAKGAARRETSSDEDDEGDADDEEESDNDLDDEEFEEGDEDDEDDEESSASEQPVPKKSTRAAQVAATSSRRPRNSAEADPNGFVAEDDMWQSESDEETVQPPKKQNRAEAQPPASSKRFSAAAAKPVPAPIQDDDESDDDGAEDDEEEEAYDDDDNEEVEFDDDDEDDEEDTSSGSGEWVDVTQSDEDDEEESAPETASEAPPAVAAVAAAVAEAGSAPWYEASTAKRTPGSHAGTTPATGASTAGKGSVASIRVLTDAEFAQLRAAQLGVPIKGSKKMSAKAAEKSERMSRKDELVRGLGERGKLLDPAAIETFTSKKRERDREKKIEEARQKRIDNNPFEARKKKKTKLTTTHREKQKAGKLYQMTKRSHRVAEKLKRSVTERQEHTKDMKKKSIKFRIARGWKA